MKSIGAASTISSKRWLAQGDKDRLIGVTFRLRKLLRWAAVVNYTRGIIEDIAPLGTIKPDRDADGVD